MHLALLIALMLKLFSVANQVTASGNLKNTGTAGNVELQLLKDATTTSGIDLNSGGARWYSAKGW